MKTINCSDLCHALEAADYFHANHRQTMVTIKTTTGREYIWRYKGRRDSWQRIYENMELTKDARQ